MLAKIVVVVLLAGLAIAAPAEGELQREKRQVVNPACPNAFQLTTNPCQSGQGRVYYPVPNDNTKFVQCDLLGRAYVVQCPAGLVFNQATTTCQQQVIVTQAPVVANTPCTAQALQSGQVYFPYPGDSSRFYQCTAIGTVQILQCPVSLVFDGSRLACVYVAPTTGVVNPGWQQIIPSVQQFTDTCTAAQIATKRYYFAHPDPSKFIQCDDAGQAFVMACPSGLVWNQYYETCASAFHGFGPALG